MATQTVLNLGLVKLLSKGPTPPANHDLVWLDTTVYIHKYYNVGTGAWTPFLSDASTKADISYVDAQIAIVQENIDNIAGSLNFEPPIAAGSTGQYWRGDKSWQTLNTAAVTEQSGFLYYTDARVQAFGDARYAMLIGAAFTGGVTMPALGINGGGIDVIDPSNTFSSYYTAGGMKFNVGLDGTHNYIEYGITGVSIDDGVNLFQLMFPSVNDRIAVLGDLAGFLHSGDNISLLNNDAGYINSTAGFLIQHEEAGTYDFNEAVAHLGAYFINEALEGALVNQPEGMVNYAMLSMSQTAIGMDIAMPMEGGAAKLYFRQNPVGAPGAWEQAATVAMLKTYFEKQYLREYTTSIFDFEDAGQVLEIDTSSTITNVQFSLDNVTFATPTFPYAYPANSAIYVQFAYVPPATDGYIRLKIQDN